MSRRLIVNADDLGRTVGVNDGIFEAHREGVVTSATLMVVYVSAGDAARRLAEHPELGVGLHVQLSGGRPLLPPEDVQSLVDDEGLLPRRPSAGLADARRADIEREVRAQLAHFEELTGRAPTHLDSHHHAHSVPVVCDVVGQIAHELSVPVRNASPEVAGALRRLGVRTTDAFDDRFYDAGVTLDTLLEAVDSVGEGVTELMCHPGRADDVLRSASTYADVRDLEIRLLCDPSVRERIAARGIEVTHFGRL